MEITMSIQAENNALTQFQWARQPQAEVLIAEMVANFLDRLPEAAAFRDRLRDDTGTRFVDWIDTIFVKDDVVLRQRLVAVGFEPDRHGAYVNREGMFPRIRLGSRSTTAVQFRVDSAADFADVHKLAMPIEGESLAQYRRVLVANNDAAELWAAERHGYQGFDVAGAKLRHPVDVLATLESFRARRRDYDDDAAGYDHAMKLIEASPLPLDYTCDLFFQSEREFWMKKNRAAQVQYTRQQKVGLGWANHDHHTYRCSRGNFSRLVAVWEKLGLVCRERFYAGREAGWGAQVMEQPNARIVTFNDVDLTPKELMNDFSHEPLVPRDRLGTVGLWCGLHGDSFLQAGMHHLECQFDFESLKQQLENEHGVRVMKPFTDFPFLRQAFTEGERWKVDAKRIDVLLGRGLITVEQAKQFREQGAIGSHLENLERNEGFKGFNQTGVSEIISATDPRKHLHNE
jgi:hypothetical protein